MSGTYWSVQDCAWVPCEGQSEACPDPLGLATDEAAVEVPSQREAVPVPADA